MFFLCGDKAASAITGVVLPIGGGLIYSLLTGKSTQGSVEITVAASTLKHFIEDGYNMVTVSEVEKVAGGDSSGRVQR